MKYRKRPVVVEAAQWSAANPRPVLELLGWVHDEEHGVLNAPKGYTGNDPTISADVSFDNGAVITLHTLEGDMTLSEGNWLIKGIEGEFYPCRDDIFVNTYEPVE